MHTCKMSFMICSPTASRSLSLRISPAKKVGCKRSGVSFTPTVGQPRLKTYSFPLNIGKRTRSTGMPSPTGCGGKALLMHGSTRSFSGLEEHKERNGAHHSAQNQQYLDS